MSLPSRLKYVRVCSSNQLVKWKNVLLLSLITLTFVLITMFYLSVSNSASPHGTRTKIISMNKDLCIPSQRAAKVQKAVIVVSSARNHFERRSVIRQTYGSVKGVRKVAILAVVFILENSDGQEGDEADDDRRLQAESDNFGDMIMGDFVGMYRNLTLKTIMAFDWLTSHCKKAQFVVKTNDDTVVNIFEIVKHLESLSPADVSSSNIWCRVDQSESAVSDGNNRFSTSVADFPTGKYPDHCSGIGYITTFTVIERLLEEIFKSFLGGVSTHEDVFMTAIVPTHINSNPHYFWWKPEPIELVHQAHSINCIFEDGRDDDDHFLRNFVRSTTMDADSKNLVTFRERYPKRFFFLIAHTDELADIHLRLWDIIQKSYTT